MHHQRNELAAVAAVAASQQLALQWDKPQTETATRYNGWSNSSTFWADFYLSNDSRIYDAINQMAADGQLTGKALMDYSMTLRARQFEKEGGKRVPGCGFYLPDYAEGKVNWEEIAEYWRTEVYSPQWTPTQSSVPEASPAPIQDDILKALAECTVTTGSVLKLPERYLERTLYQRVKRVIEQLGGKWNRSAQGFIFAEGNPEPLIEAVVQTGTFTKPDNYGYFPTPADLAAQIAALLDLQPGMTALEPSGGTGALAVELSKVVGKQNVTVVELQAKNVTALVQQGYTVVEGDFLTYQPTQCVDRILMNPPFAGQADISHVTHAWSMLKPRGRLVSIMAASVVFRDNAKTRAFRALVEAHGTITANPDGAFRESGTMVRTVTVVLNKPGVAELSAPLLLAA